MARGKLGVGCIITILVVVVLALMLYGVGKRAYNSFVVLDEQVNKSWADVQNVLQRRMDLIPNLVETVKGYANFERSTLEAVIQARANATKVQLDANQLAQNPQMLEQYMQAQNQMSSALSRLMVVVEQYPDLKANQSFLRLQDELAGTENRIAVERRRFNETVQAYNKYIRLFPNNILAGIFNFDKRAYFEAPEAAQTAPKVDFGTSK
jgi:LemA protein